MKKIVVCIALAIVSMMSAAASFLVNDAPAYRDWAQMNRPKIMETFGKDKKDKLDKPGKMPPPAARPRKEEQRAPMMEQPSSKMDTRAHHQNEHDRTPAQDAPATPKEEGNQ